MKTKLSEIFVADKGNHLLASNELRNLKLQPHFLQQISELFRLTYKEGSIQSNDVCFANSSDVRADYRNTFFKEDVLEIVLLQIRGRVNLENDKVYFPKSPQDFFSKNYRAMLRIKAEKQKLRETALQRRNCLPRKEQQEYSKKICDQIWQLIEKNRFQTIHSYLPMGSEVNLTPLLQKALALGLTVVVPKTLKSRQMQNLILKDLKNMELGIFNTYHPKNTSEYTGEYDMVIVAGLLFDRHGYRIGYGGGYYDTFLAHQKEALKVGVCYPFQRVESLPKESHDVPLDLLTDGKKLVVLGRNNDPKPL